MGTLQMAERKVLFPGREKVSLPLGVLSVVRACVPTGTFRYSCTYHPVERTASKFLWRFPPWRLLWDTRLWILCRSVLFRILWIWLLCRALWDCRACTWAGFPTLQIPNLKLAEWIIGQYKCNINICSFPFPFFRLDPRSSGSAINLRCTNFSTLLLLLL